MHANVHLRNKNVKLKVLLKLQSVKDKEEEESLLGQAEIWKYMTCFTDSFALKCAVELRIADIIDRYGKPLSLSKIIDNIEDAPSPDASLLLRIMRVLVRKKIFSAAKSDNGEILYGLTRASKWILQDTKMTLAPMLLLENHPLHLNPAHFISDIIREGTDKGTAFFRCHGHEQFDLTGLDPEYNKLFNEGMVCTARMVIKAVIEGYKEGFNKIESLVDVGGGLGGSLSEIVRAYPHIKGINFDLPHVVATAPQYDGITHVGGDMFVSVPKADAIYMKWILHDWSDQHCIKILKNCRKAIPENGKVIIVDHVLQPEGNDLFDDTGFAFDMMLLAHNAGGKERTEENWKWLFAETGFPRYNIIKIKALPSIIEAFPN
ncbi:(R,S)-reticuline 7-O-methyltransferase isoform X1 [Arachis ipaensis]|uniref:(R,S)-reticuline 7-O-methyltransferase isoform X1 n=1 Tax=Arachis ipaensis TaxID=130454 RepID=UPI000A2AF94B|nr:(R,S)-reticuline 7-O-methyltransferase isoform X1 [Arachis ipaensis]